MSIVIRAAAITLLLALLITATAQVSEATLEELRIAAAFTEGVIYDCSDSSNLAIHLIAICLDTSESGHGVNELMRRSTHELTGWTAVRPWAFRAEDGIYGASFMNLERGKGEVIIVIIRDNAADLIYFALPLEDAAGF